MMGWVAMPLLPDATQYYLDPIVLQANKCILLPANAYAQDARFLTC